MPADATLSNYANACLATTVARLAAGGFAVGRGGNYRSVDATTGKETILNFARDVNGGVIPDQQTVINCCRGLVGEENLPYPAVVIE
ncbi:MAG: hypothetical protein IT558_01420 [Alphaproteobacteria bacterium]|nr:hypothetical protein [Alphaproteobacteria bacterium]